MDDIDFINKLKASDQGAFRQVVDLFQRFVLNTCFRFVNDYDIAEDLSQEVFIEVFRSIEKFRSDSKLSTWIYRIAVTKSLDYLKSQKRKKRFAVLLRLFNKEDMRKIVANSNEKSPEQLSENNERVMRLQWAIDSLPENQKIAFTLSKYDELSHGEIAEILETTESSVAMLVFRAKKNLKKKLYNYYKDNL